MCSAFTVKKSIESIILLYKRPTSAKVDLFAVGLVDCDTYTIPFDRFRRYHRYSKV